MLYIIIAILAGACIVLSRIINFNLADKIGIFQGTLLNYIVGLFFSFIFLFFSGEKLVLGIDCFILIPWWAYWGGFLGVAVVILSTYLTPKLSAFYLTIFTFVGQLFAGSLIDYFTKSMFSIGKIIGGMMVLMGLTYNLILDKNGPNAKETNIQ